MEYWKATLEDIGILARLRVDMLCELNNYSDSLKSLIRGNTETYMINGLRDGSLICWVASESGRITAMGCVNFFSLPPNDWCPNGKTAYIGNMYTLPAFRGQGLGSGILERLIGEAKARDCQRILLHTSDMGRPLYEKHGFQAAPTAMALFPFGIIPSD